MKLNVFRNDLLVGVLDIHASEPFFGFKYAGEYLKLPDALNEATTAASNRGFVNAHDIANRILTECNKRAGNI